MAKGKWAPTPDQLTQIEAMAGFGLSTDKIAILLGVSERTLQRAAEHDHTVRDTLERGRAKVELQVRKGAYDAAKAGNVTMQIFLLKTKYGFREVERLELTGADGGPIETKKIDMSDEELDKRLAKYDRALEYIARKKASNSKT